MRDARSAESARDECARRAERAGSGSAGRELKAREAPIQDYKKVFQTRCAIETARSAGRGEDETKVQKVLCAACAGSLFVTQRGG